MDPRSGTRGTFETVWKEIKDQLGEDAKPLSLDPDALWKWWPTLRHITPDIEMLSQALMNFGFNPYISLLTVYCFGYSQGLDDMMEERIWPRSQAHQESHVPPWLDELINEDLVKKFGDNH